MDQCRTVAKHLINETIVLLILEFSNYHLRNSVFVVEMYLGRFIRSKSIIQIIGKPVYIYLNIVVMCVCVCVFLDIYL